MTSGVLAVGDSITYSCEFPSGNLPMISWGEWVARALGEPLDVQATSGATTPQIRDLHLPAVTGPYRLGVVYVGTNDILVGPPMDEFASAFESIAARLAETCETVVAVTLPSWVGRMPTVMPYGLRGRRVRLVRDAVREISERHGFIVVPAPDLKGPAVLAVDRIHPTAGGHILFGDTVARALRDAGWELPLPSELAQQAEPVTVAEWREWVRRTLRRGLALPARRLGRTLLGRRG